MNNHSNQPITNVENNNRDRLRKEKPQVYEKILKFDEKIERGESIAIIQFQYDYSCNFSCQHCSIEKFRKPKNQQCFTINDVKNLAQQADELGLAHVVITGGEPLVFPDFDALIEAFDPQRFYLTSDTNGWLLDSKKAKHLKSIGLDKIQLSLDSMSGEGHDLFRRKRNSFDRVLRAVDATLEAGLHLILATVLTKGRAKSDEFRALLEFAKSKSIGVYVSYAKPVGAWEGNFDILVSNEDVEYIKHLGKEYNVFTHLTPSYGQDLGCIAMKRMISVTKYGDIQPCPYFHCSIGNFFDEPLKDILERGMSIKHFSKKNCTCLVGEDRDFISTYVTKTYQDNVPVSYKEVFREDDFIKRNK